MLTARRGAREPGCCSRSSGCRSASCCTGSRISRRRSRPGSRRSRPRPIVLVYPLFLVIFGRSAMTIIMIGFVAGLAPVILKTIEGLAGVRPVLLKVGDSFKLTPWQQFWKIVFPAAVPTIFTGLRLGLIFALINIVGVEFLINFGGLGQLINELAERYDLPGTYAAIVLRHPGERRVLRRRAEDRAMAASGHVTTGAGEPALARPRRSSAHRLRRWRCSSCGRLSPPRACCSGRRALDPQDRAALVAVLADPAFYRNLGVTACEVAFALAIGGAAGLAIGILLGGNRFLAAALRALPLLSRADAEDHLLPDHDHVVRRRAGLEDGDGRAVLLLPDRDQRRGRHARDRHGPDPRRPQLPRLDVADGRQDLSAGDARAGHQRPSARARHRHHRRRCSPRPSCRTRASAS